MNKIIIYCFFILLTGCSIQKKSVYNPNLNGIVYILPKEVNSLITEQLKNSTENYFFKLKHIDNYNYILYFLQKENSFWHKSTNRYIFLEGEFYPLVLESDNFFSIKQDIKEFKKNNYNIFTKTYIGNEYSYRIKFNIHGKILYHGYGDILHPDYYDLTK